MVDNCIKKKKKIFIKKKKKKLYNSNLKIINTCLLTGTKKSTFNKSKLNRHFVRDKKKNLFDYWQVNSW